MKINHLKYPKIDFKAYDNCIEQSSQRRIYALSWYLDIISPGWELLMADNYSYVMPIPVKKKFLISKSAIQSSASQQLGIFSAKELDAKIFKSFIDAIPCRSYDLRFNPNNIFSYSNLGVCTNYILDLNRSYENIKEKYKQDRLRIVESPQNLVFEKSENIESYWDFIVTNCNSHRDLRNLQKFRLIVDEAVKRELFEIWIAKGSHKNELKASVCLLKWEGRIYYSHPASTQQQAMTCLLDRCIKEYANSDLVLDFMASSSPTSARFIESFGAVFEPYPRLTK